PGEFEWDGMTRTTVIAAGEIGMLFSYLVSARICEIFGTRHIVGFSFLINGGLACLQPTFIRFNVWLYVCPLSHHTFDAVAHSRYMEASVKFYPFELRDSSGLWCPMGRGSVIPGFNILFTRWLVGKERMIVAALVFSAQIVGTLISMFTAANIIYLFGWDGIYYLNGMLSVPFFVSWMYIVYDSPRKHPRISEEEKKYLMTKTNMDYKIVPRAPWLKIIMSLPLWAHIAVSMSTAWINYTISIQLPLYLTKVFHFNIETTCTVASAIYSFRDLSVLVGAEGYRGRLGSHATPFTLPPTIPQNRHDVSISPISPDTDGAAGIPDKLPILQATLQMFEDPYLLTVKSPSMGSLYQYGRYSTISHLFHFDT
ncbi:unnamed protein product, partial [Timema podura]|nr:unnamed protein product [Timema podura]